MSYYPSEKEGKGYLRSGYKVMPRKPHTSNDAMLPCYEFDSHGTCARFCKLLFQGFEQIYKKYNQPPINKGDKVYWISVYSQSHLRNLVVPNSLYCKDPAAYKFHYTFNDDVVCNKAMREMQTFANNLYLMLTTKK